MFWFPVEEGGCEYWFLETGKNGKHCSPSEDGVSSVADVICCPHL